jgi:hypothetical protein
MRILLVIFLILFSMPRIIVDDVGDGWKSDVELALTKIKKVDYEKYQILIRNCNHIGFWNGKFSTTEDSTILISSRDAKLKNINNIAAILVHESMHLSIKHDNIELSKKSEECMCYVYELDFLRQIPDVEEWLINHTQLQVNNYSDPIYK